MDMANRVPVVISSPQRGKPFQSPGSLTKTAGVVGTICFSANILNQMFTCFLVFIPLMRHQAFPNSRETDLV